MVTFEDTPNRHKTIVPTGLQILNQAKLVEDVGVEPIKKAVNQPVIEGQSSLGL
jgi:hypothetical protein